MFQAYRAARREHTSALEKQEHELRTVLARCLKIWILRVPKSKRGAATSIPNQVQFVVFNANLPVEAPTACKMHE